MFYSLLQCGPGSHLAPVHTTKAWAWCLPEHSREQRLSKADGDKDWTGLNQWHKIFWTLAFGLGLMKTGLDFFKGGTEMRHGEPGGRLLLPPK